MTPTADRGPLAGRCRECYCTVDTISDVCPEHEIDDKAWALRLLAQQFSKQIALDVPGRLVVTTAPVYGLPWVDFVLHSSPSSAASFADSESTGHRRMRLECYEIGAGPWRGLWAYSHDWSHDHRLATLLMTWQAASHPTKTGRGR